MEEDKLELVLFSNHVFSDGFSGYVILRDFLRVLTKTMDQDTEYHKAVPTSLPLQKSIFEQVIPRTFFRTLYDKFVAKLAFRGISLFIPYIKTSLQKIPKISDNQNCTQHFASGTAGNLQKALEICRSEKTTLIGPICIAIALSIANATESIQKDTTHIKMMASVDYNLRNRVGMGKEHVGLNIGMSNPNVFHTPGLALDAPFWETARSLKEIITKTGDDAGFHMGMAMFEHIPMDQFYTLAAKVPEGSGNLSDVNISNLGRWPFSDTIGPLSLDEVYLYHNLSSSKMGMPIVFFVTSIHSLQYGMTSTLADDTATDTIFDTVVQIVESVRSIGPTTTLREVHQKVTQGSPTD